MKTTILIAEYSRIQRLTSERVLRKAGFVVLHADDGMEVLRQALDSIPDVILLDILLPKLSGREVMRALKQNPQTAQIPILVFSGLPQANEKKLRKDGAAGYFEKSRLVEDGADGERELIKLIEEIVEESRKPAEIKKQTASASK